MTNPPDPTEELFDIAGSLYLLLRRYNTGEKQAILSVLAELINREPQYEAE